MFGGARLVRSRKCFNSRSDLVSRAKISKEVHLLLMLSFPICFLLQRKILFLWHLLLRQVERIGGEFSSRFANALLVVDAQVATPSASTLSTGRASGTADWACATLLVPPKLLWLAIRHQRWVWDLARDLFLLFLAWVPFVCFSSVFLATVLGSGR